MFCTWQGAQVRSAPPSPIGCAAPQRLSDGSAVVVRSMRTGDETRLEAFIAGLSAELRYNRFLSGRALTPQEIARLSHIDYGREAVLIALAASAGQAPVLGEARYVKEAEGASAEFAVAVADAWQGRGVGSLLLEALVAAARANGIARLHGITLANNYALHALVRKLGFALRPYPRDATLRVVEKMLLPRGTTRAVAGEGPRRSANDEAPAAGASRENA